VASYSWYRGLHPKSSEFVGDGPYLIFIDKSMQVSALSYMEKLFNGIVELKATSLCFFQGHDKISTLTSIQAKWSLRFKTPSSGCG
jgi:hypothetical protein